MRRSLISVAGANSRAGKAQISVAGDLLASLNPVNLQQKVNEFQRGVGLSSLRGDKIAEAIHYATKSRFEDTNSCVKNAPKARNGLLRYARNDEFKATFSQNRQGSLNSASSVLKNTQNRQGSLNTPNSLNNSLNLKTPPPQWF